MFGRRCRKSAPRIVPWESPMPRAFSKSVQLLTQALLWFKMPGPKKWNLIKQVEMNVKKTVSLSSQEVFLIFSKKQQDILYVGRQSVFWNLKPFVIVTFWNASSFSQVQGSFRKMNPQWPLIVLYFLKKVRTNVFSYDFWNPCWENVLLSLGRLTMTTIPEAQEWPWVFCGFSAKFPKRWC